MEMWHEREVGGEKRSMLISRIFQHSFTMCQTTALLATFTNDDADDSSSDKITSTLMIVTPIFLEQERFRGIPSQTHLKPGQKQSK